MTEPVFQIERNVVTQLRQQIVDGSLELRTAYENRPSSSALLRGRAALVDSVLIALWREAAMPDTAAMVAVGGYGRGELFPHSDVDLMFLLPEAADADTKAKLTAMVGALWDIGLEIGQTVRTLQECLDAAADDITIQTNLLEARFLFGNQALYNEFSLRYRAMLDVSAFFKAKNLEQEQRYARHNDSPYSLEPNCKESPGGLRDLQMLGWIARAAGVGHNWRELARNRLITGHEASELRSIECFLEHVRIQLHFQTGRAEDRLLFDYQEALASRMGIQATATKRASEVLMQRYYLTAKKLTQINTILLQNYATVIFPDQGGSAITINPRFQMVRELLDVRADDVFEKHPSALLECFLLLQQRPELRGMTARTLRLLWLNRKRINAAFRAKPEHRALFMEILQQRRGVVQAFRRMNQYGILSHYLPPWRRILCQMQHDLFHAYTVDQHTLMVLRNVRRFTQGKHAHEYPAMTHLMLNFERQWLLYVAALFHDIAKGRGGDHSLLGMVDVALFCDQHGIQDEDKSLVVWLVQYHLTMSTVAQKQDISDPETIQRFAAIVQNERRLIALYLLTHADIRGTSPKVWNGWRSKLLEDLFLATQRLLRGATPQEALGLDERHEDARRSLRYFGLQADVETAFWSKLDQVYFMRNSAEEIAWHTRHLYYRPSCDEPVVKARVTDQGDGLQVMIYTKDQKDLFVRLTGFFGRLGLSILEARVHTTRHGYALDSFILQYPGQEAQYRDIVQLIEHELAERLRNETLQDRPRSGRLSRHVRHFPITPEVSIRPDESGKHYILSLMAADRPGLLFSVAEVLAKHEISVLTAKIVTLGERVEDTFLITGRGLSVDSHVLRVEREVLNELQI